MSYGTPDIGTDRLREWIARRRPSVGTMGVLYQQRRGLYWLVVTVGVLAYTGLVAFLTLSVGLLLLAGLRALLATAGGVLVPAYAWFGLAVLTFVSTVLTTYLAARVASQYEVSE